MLIWRRLDTRDHKLIKKLFTEVINQEGSFSHKPTCNQTSFWNQFGHPPASLLERLQVLDTSTSLWHVTSLSEYLQIQHWWLSRHSNTVTVHISFIETVRTIWPSATGIGQVIPSSYELLSQFPVQCWPITSSISSHQQLWWRACDPGRKKIIHPAVRRAHYSRVQLDHKSAEASKRCF